MKLNKYEQTFTKINFFNRSLFLLITFITIITIIIGFNKAHQYKENYQIIKDLTSNSNEIYEKILSEELAKNIVRNLLEFNKYNYKNKYEEIAKYIMIDSQANQIIIKTIDEKYVENTRTFNIIRVFELTSIRTTKNNKGYLHQLKGIQKNHNAEGIDKREIEIGITTTPVGIDVSRYKHLVTKINLKGYKHE